MLICFIYTTKIIIKFHIRKLSANFFRNNNYYFKKKNGFYHHDSIHSAFNDLHFTESEATLRLIILLKILNNLSVNLVAKYDSLQERISRIVIAISFENLFYQFVSSFR